MIITHKLKIDLMRQEQYPPVSATQGDTYSRAVEISLYSGGAPWNLPNGHDIVIRYCKPDGTTGIYDTLPDGSVAWSTDGNTVSVILCPQMLTCPGKVSAQVGVIVGERILATFPFSVFVAPDPSAGTVRSEPYCNWRNAFLPQTKDAQEGQFLQIAKVDASGRVIEVVAVENPAGTVASNAAEALRISQEVAQEMHAYSPSGTRSIAEAAMRMADQRIIAPEQAAVGQYFRVKEIDENGKITAVEAVDAPAGGGSGLTTAEKTLILSLFKNAAYTSDMSETITQLEALWSVSYKVSYNLTGVSASNNASAVVENGTYTTTLTADGGYSLTGATVKVTMGGVDITSTVYSNGVITIASVTGNVVISVVAKEIPSYSVTNNLTGMTNCNSATKVTEGDFYSATLSVMDGYELSSVVITMGGVDVTADVYNTDGTILITEVTGDIVITAVAAQPTVIPFITGDADTTYAYSGGEDTDAKQFVKGNERIALCVRAGATSTYKVRATNNTESDITCDIWCGDLISANVGLNNNINVYNAVKAKASVAVAAGTSITFTATVNGGYYPGIVATNAGLDYEFTGSIPEMSYEDITELTVHTGVKATLYTADGSDGDTSTTNWNFIPRTADEIMSEDTEFEIIVSNISDALIKGAIQFTQTLGAYASGEVTGYYYTKVSDNAYVYPGLDIVAKYTVKAGNALCVNACGTSSDIVVKYRRV